MEKEELIENLELQVSRQKLENSVLKSQNNGLKASLSTEVRVADELRKSKAAVLIEKEQLKTDLKVLKTIALITGAVAVIEFFIIIIK